MGKRSILAADGSWEHAIKIYEPQKAMDLTFPQKVLGRVLGEVPAKNGVLGEVLGKVLVLLVPRRDIALS